MGRALEIIEQLSLQFDVLVFCEFPRRHADVLHVSDPVTLRVSSVVHCSAVPQYLKCMLVK